MASSQLADSRDGTVELAATEREERLGELVVALADENANLQRALDTRVVIEQAKGVLAERFGLDVHEAFHVLRMSARSNRMRLYDLATQVVESRQTPPEIEQTLARGSRS
jgi:AmiR/NasT family two-component response regulator